MNLSIGGRRALVAGSSSGIGSAIAIQLAQEGVEVIVHGRSAANANLVRAQIEAAGGRAITVLASLDQPGDVDRLARDALSIGPIDILINCAGAASTFYHWFDSPPDAWRKQFQITTFYAIDLIRAIVPQMRKRGWGRVVNVSSGMAYAAKSVHPEYAAAKLALHSVTASLSAEVGGDGVTVNTIVPGIFMTENTAHVIKEAAHSAGFTETGVALERRVLRELWQADVSLGRVGLIDELAAAACFLSSERASYITGAALRVDGGATKYAC